MRVKVAFLVQPKFLLQAVFRLGEGFGGVVEDSKLLLAREVPLNQAANLLLMPRDAVLLTPAGEHVVEEFVG